MASTGAFPCAPVVHGSADALQQQEQQCSAPARLQAEPGAPSAGCGTASWLTRGTNYKVLHSATYAAARSLGRVAD